MTKKTTIVAVDVETTGLSHKKNRLHGTGRAYSSGSEYTLGKFFPESEHIVGHNLRFDLKFIGYTPTKTQQLWDTRIMASLVNENEPLGLKYLAQKYLGSAAVENFNELDETVRRLKMKSVADLCEKDLDEGGYTDLIGRYCKEDCENTLALFHVLGKKLREVHEKQVAAGFKKTALDYLKEEAMPLERVLLDIENRGIRIDVDKLTKFREQLLSENQAYVNEMDVLAESEIAEIEEELYQEQVAKRKSPKGKAAVKRAKRFNWQSSDHVARLVYVKVGVPAELVSRTKTGKYDTSEKQMRSLQKSSNSERLKKLLEIYLVWKKNLKLLTTYTGEKKGLLAHVHNGRVFAEYLQTGRGKEGLTGGTVTGRLSSRSPNMQNLPRGGEIKEFFVPDTPAHVFVYFDYSQLELRLAAHLSKDPKLMAAYLEGLDLHQNTADRLGIDRQFGKMINFAMVYNASKYRLHGELGDKYSLDQCEEIRNEFFAEYSGYAKYLEEQQKLMVTRGVVVSETGRVRRLPALLSPPRQPWSKEAKAFRHALNQGYNFPIQCLGASITKRAMIELHKQGFDLVTQVHDSVVFQAEKEQADALAVKAKGIAEMIYPLSVPLKADVKILSSLNEKDLYQEKGADNAKRTENRSKFKVISGGN